jgi:hypothetical protein
MIELHGVKYYSPKDISDNFPVTLEFVQEKIDSGDLDSCIIDEKIYVCEEIMIEFFTKKKG